MSGGSWDYVYRHIADIADRLCQSKCPLRRALGRKLAPFEDAMMAIEWVDSCDWSSPADTDAIKKALGEQWPAMELAVIAEDARAVLEQLKAAIERCAEVEKCQNLNP